MAAKNLTHLRIGGRCVTLDIRDNSVVLSNDHDGCVYDGMVFNGARIGHLTGARGRWTATAVNGQKTIARTRPEAIRWLWRIASDQGVTARDADAGRAALTHFSMTGEWRNPAPQPIGPPPDEEAS